MLFEVYKFQSYSMDKEKKKQSQIRRKKPGNDDGD